MDRRSRHPESGAQRRTGHARRGCGRPSAQSARFGGLAVFHLRDGSAAPGRQIHDLWPRFGGDGCRAEDLRESCECRWCADRAHCDLLGGDSRHAAARTCAILERNTRRAGPIPCGARDLGRPGHHRVLSRQGPGARTQLPAARAVRSFRRHGVPSGRPWFRLADRGTQHARAAHRQAQKHVHKLAPEFAIRNTSRASSRWLAATTQRAR